MGNTRRRNGARASSGGKAETRFVVGVGASVGGLEGFRKLLSATPVPNGMTFILVQHLAPDHESLLAELLARSSTMEISEAEDGDPLLPDRVYVIPPNANIGVRNGAIELTPPLETDGIRRPIDHLFRSLAKGYGSRAAAVVLSGAGSDGSAGAIEVKAAGGLTIAQEPETAVQSGMPKSAIETGAVDLVLAIHDIPTALARFAEFAPSRQANNAGEGPVIMVSKLEANDLERLAHVLDAHGGFNLRVYKLGTVERRVLRRMALAGQEDLAAYLRELEQNPSEQRALIRDLLISVTDFFRDIEAFAALRALVITPLVESSRPDEPLRVWVPGCATGEEAYSIAIEFLDVMASLGKHRPLQVFATDVDADALAIGRTGLYPAATADHVPADRLQKWFLPVGDRGYQVNPTVRNTVSFALHDLTKDPPFSRMHLVSCRNVLIYLRASTQEQVLRALHFSLLPDGCLFLGSSESIRPQRLLFSTLSKPWRLFRKVGSSRPLFLPRGGVRPTEDAPVHRQTAPDTERPGRRAPVLADLARRAVMQARVPPTIVVAESGAVLFMHGELRPYLRFPEGDPRLDLASIVTPDLSTRTRAALYKCRRDQAAVVAHSSPDGATGARTKITATPAFELGAGTVILSFEEAAGEPLTTPAPSESPAHEAIIEELEGELQATREDLHNTVEELESYNEELRTSNEETLSMNEELQSANEELEATTEELRSLNEELTTVNAQLREKVEQVERAHDDLENFFASTKIATLFLDERLCIKRFTPAAEELLRIDHGDEGRFAGDIARELFQADLIQDAREVLSHLSGKSREIRTSDGRWVTRKVLPYRTESRRIEGIVVTWVDITDLKRATEQLAIRERQQAVIARVGLSALEEANLQHFLEQAVREIQQTLETDYCKILELQPDGEVLLLRAGIGWKEGLVGNACVPGGMDSQAGFTLKLMEPVIVEDLSKERRFSGPPILAEHGVKSGVSCIITGPDDAYGVLGVHTRERRTFTGEDANFLQAAASVIAGGIGRHATRKRLAFESAAAAALAEAVGAKEAVARIQAAASQVLGTSVGELWRRTSDGGCERMKIFTTEPYVEEQIAASFGPNRLAKGEGVAGRVFERRRAEWLSTLQSESKFARVNAARSLGLRSGLAFPIGHGAEPFWVVTFFSTERIHADSVFLRSLESIGRSVGDFVRRQEIEQRFRMTVDNAPHGIADCSLDGRFLHVNDRLCAITGFSREALLGRSSQDLTHPEERAREDELRRELLEGKRDKYTLEERYIRNDGKVTWVSLSAAIVPEVTGQPAYMVLVLEDISSRKAADAELRASEEQLRQILRSSPALMMIYDEEDAIVALSRSWTAVTGWTPEDIPTMSAWVERAFHERAAEVKAEIDATFTQDASERASEIDVFTKEGDKLTLLFRSVPLGKTREGRRLRLAVAEDITERRKFERELLDASRQKDEFIAMLGHELRNPLAAVRTATELLKRTHPDDARLQRMQSVLERQTNHMAKLLDGILDISRIIHGKITLQKQVIDLVGMVSEALSDIGGRLPPGLELASNLDSAPTLIEADPIRLTQIVDNLISNAIKYTPPPGRITVAVTEDDGMAELRVKDTGGGIDPSLLPNLFKPFQQGRQNLARTQGGLGLGLALVKALVEMHGGSVKATSEGTSRGAEFVVRLPLSKRPASPTNPEQRTPEKLRVLVIEDNEDVAEMLKEALSLEGHEVTIALRGEAGIRLAQETLPDVILCDLGLPEGVTGYDVARALRADPRTQGLFLAALTGYGRPEDKARTEAAGFDTHLTKPVSLDALTDLFAKSRNRKKA